MIVDTGSATLDEMLLIEQGASHRVISVEDYGAVGDEAVPTTKPPTTDWAAYLGD